MSTINERVKQKSERIKNYDAANHHPLEKVHQLEQHIDLNYCDVLEIYAGRGNLTKYYNQHASSVTSLTRVEELIEMTDDNLKQLMTKVVDSGHYLHKLIWEHRTFEVIDVDGYNDGGDLAHNIFKLIADDGHLIWTFPFVNCGAPPNIHKRHRYKMFWNDNNPDEYDFFERMKEYASMELFELELISIINFNKMRRIIIKCTKQKSTRIVEQFK